MLQHIVTRQKSEAYFQPNWTLQDMSISLDNGRKFRPNIEQQQSFSYRINLQKRKANSKFLTLTHRSLRWRVSGNFSCSRLWCQFGNHGQCSRRSCSVQTSSLRTTQARRRNHVASTPRSLHCLPVRQRVILPSLYGSLYSWRRALATELEARVRSSQTQYSYKHNFLRGRSGDLKETPSIAASLKI